MAKRRRKTPPRNSKGRFIKASSARRNPPRKRKAARRRMLPKSSSPRRQSYAAGFAAGAASKRKSYRRNPVRKTRRRRSYRRNPSIGIRKFFSAPTLKQVGFTVAGLAGTPFIEGMIMNALPANWKNKWVNYGVRIVTVYGLGKGVSKVVNRNAGNAVYIGGAVYIALGFLREFFPTLIPAGTASGGTGKYLNSQPLLGKYLPARRGGMGSAITANTPTRLNPGMRF